jgi:hypothetical protein
MAVGQLGLGQGHLGALGGAGIPVPPTGFVFIVRANGTYLTRANGTYLIKAAS